MNHTAMLSLTFYTYYSAQSPALISTNKIRLKLVGEAPLSHQRGICSLKKIGEKTKMFLRLYTANVEPTSAISSP